VVKHAGLDHFLVDIQLKAGRFQDLFFNRVDSLEAENADLFQIHDGMENMKTPFPVNLTEHQDPTNLVLLADTVGAIHGLEILVRIPIAKGDVK
jgi:hypothetical protein